MLGKIWGLALVVLGGYVAYQVAYNPEIIASIEALTPKLAKAKPAPAKEVSPKDIQPDPKEYVLAPKTQNELTLEIMTVCREMTEELVAAKLAPTVGQVKLRFREKRLETKFLKEQLGQCFKTAKGSPTFAEVEVFSSDFAGENSAHQVQLQASIMSGKKENKVFEVGRKFELAKKLAKLSETTGK